MLTITGQQYRFCDGLSRRGFLTVGGLAMGGLTLPQLLRAEAQQGTGRSHKAIINIFLPGGPPHQDMWDLKPNAPKEVRGEFDEISTNVPGIRIGDQSPLMAKMMDKFTIIRSMVGANGRHDAWQCQTGRGNFGNQPPGGWPSMGAVLSRMRGAAATGVLGQERGEKGRRKQRNRATVLLKQAGLPIACKFENRTVWNV